METGSDKHGKIKNLTSLLITAVLFAFAAVFVLDRSKDNWKNNNIKTHKTSTHTIADFVTR